MTVAELVQFYDLCQHPEGGYFKETFRSREVIPKGALSSQFGGERNCSTAIYFLLPQGTKSHLHKIASDEVWHFYLGGPMDLVEIDTNGLVKVTTLGQDIKSGHKLQHVVPAGNWFGGFPRPESEYSFLGCTVSPGFDFAEFELGKRSELTNLFPHAEKIITELT